MFLYYATFNRRQLIEILAGQVPVGLELFDFKFNAVEKKDLIGVTGQRMYNLNRMVTKRTPKPCHKIDNPALIQELYNYLESNSDVANRDHDAKKIEGNLTRNRYLSKHISNLFKQFTADHDISLSSVWNMFTKHPRFKIFKISNDRNRDVALCEKWLRLDLLENSILNCASLEYLDTKSFLGMSICETPSQACYSGSCKSCSVQNFVLMLKNQVSDNNVYEEKIKYMTVSKNGEDILENESSVLDFIENVIPSIYYAVGRSGTGQKLAAHVLRANESYKYKHWCYEEVQKGESILIWMDYAMELARLDPHESQNQHFRRKGFPLLGGVESLPGGKKYYRYWIGETNQSKSVQFTIKALEERCRTVHELIDDPQAIKNAIIISDGAGDFWCTEMMAYYPKIFDVLKQNFPNLGHLSVTKGTSGHGKSEIDSS